MVSVSDRSEIAFFDVETTIPTRTGQGFAILEFGAILICPRKLVELESYSTLVRPTDLSLISSLSVRFNGITKDAVVSASTFAQIADRVYDILHGRIWAGHNILRFDCARIREAFAEINRSPPEPKGTIDSLALLTERFGRRAGDMKMATLATYFGLGQQTHRSLGDVRMNVEVLKHCATVLFLESCLPEIFIANSRVSPNATTRSYSNGKASPDGFSMNTNTSSSSIKIENHQISFPTNQRIEGNHPTPSLMTPNTGDEVPDHAESNTACPDPFNMGPLSNEVGREPLQSDENMEEESGSGAPEYSTAAGSEGSRVFADFLVPDEFSIPSTSVSLAPFYRGTQRIRILHKDITLGMNTNAYSSSIKIENHQISFPTNQRIEGNHPALSLMTPNTGDQVSDHAKSNTTCPDPCNMGPLSNEVGREPLQSDETMEEESVSGWSRASSTAAGSGASRGFADFLEPDEVSIPSISVSLAPFYRGTQRIEILHKDITLQLCCSHLKVRFGINTKFVYSAGRPRLSFVVDATPNLCRVLDACDSLAQRLNVDSGGSSEWRPVVTRKAGFLNSPTVRLHIPTVADGNIARWVTEIYEKESSTPLQRLVFSRFDVAELDALFTPGTFVDAHFSLDSYDYHKNAGIRLVAKKLILHAN